MISMRPIRGFDETMPRAIQPTKRFDYRTRHFLLVYSLVSVIRIGSCDLIPLDFFLLFLLFEAKDLSTIPQPQLCRKIVKNYPIRFTIRLKYLKTRNSLLYLIQILILGHPMYIENIETCEHASCNATL